MDDGRAPNITIEQLQAIAIVLQRGSPASAARKLGRSKNFVLGALNSLEAKMGARLVDRQGAHWQPTDAGRAAAGPLTDLLTKFDSFTLAAGVPAELGVGRLVIATDFEPGLLPLGAWAGQALAADPHLQIATRFATATRPDPEADLWISDGPATSVDWSSEVVGTIARGAFAAPGYLQANAAPTEPRELSRHTLISATSDTWGTDWKLLAAWDTNAKPIAPDVQPSIMTDSAIDAREAARAGAGIALLPLPFAVDDVRAGRLTPVLVGWRGPPVVVYCRYRTEQARNTRIAAFVDRVRAGLSELEYDARRVLPT